LLLKKILHPSLVRLYSKMTGRSRLTDTISLVTIHEVSFGTKPGNRFGDSVGKN
jgi:hypothetical protein